MFSLLCLLVLHGQPIHAAPPCVKSNPDVCNDPNPPSSYSGSSDTCTRCISRTDGCGWAAYAADSESGSCFMQAQGNHTSQPCNADIPWVVFITDPDLCIVATDTAVALGIFAALGAFFWLVVLVMGVCALVRCLRHRRAMLPHRQLVRDSPILQALGDERHWGPRHFVTVPGEFVAFGRLGTSFCTQFSFLMCSVLMMELLLALFSWLSLQGSHFGFATRQEIENDGWWVLVSGFATLPIIWIGFALSGVLDSVVVLEQGGSLVEYTRFSLGGVLQNRSFYRRSPSLIHQVGSAKVTDLWSGGGDDGPRVLSGHYLRLQAKAPDTTSYDPFLFTLQNERRMAMADAQRIVAYYASVLQQVHRTGSNQPELCLDVKDAQAS